MNKDSEKNNAIPKSKSARIALAGKTALKIGATEISHRIKHPFRSDQNKQKATQKKETLIAKELFQALGQMKGLAVKFAQFLSLENAGFLPPELLSELQKAHYKVPPINKALIRKIIYNELGDYPEKIFQSFDLTPIASASIGQVHRAALFDGTPVAVKVQYPGIDESIKADLQLLRFLMTQAPIFKNVQEPAVMNRIIKELEDMFPQEVNYEQEYQNAVYFAKQTSLPDIIIPTYYPNYSTKHILCMDFIEGLHIPEWLDTQPSQSRRNRIGQLIFDFKWTSFLRHHCIHADPNPGNMIVTSHDQLAIIDYGCVKHLDPAFIQSATQTLVAFMKKDWHHSWKIYQQMGMCSPDKLHPPIMESFGTWLAEPYLLESFDFSSNPNYTDAIQDHSLFFNEFSDIHPDYVLFDRLLIGVYRLNHMLGATINARKHLNMHI